MALLFKRKRKNNFLSFFNIKKLKKKKGYKKIKKIVSKNYILFLAIGMIISLVLGFLLIALIYHQYEKENIPEKNSKISLPSGPPNSSPPPLPASPTGLINNSINREHTRGNSQAPNTIIEYSDFECPYCAQFRATMVKLMEAYPNDVKWIYKHFPKSKIHPNAQLAAEASECAADQGKFWEYTDLLLSNQSLFSDKYFSKAAQKIGLETEKFNACLSTGKYTAKVKNDHAYGQKQGVTNTPTAFVNGKKFVGSKSLSTLKSAIKNNE